MNTDEDDLDRDTHDQDVFWRLVAPMLLVLLVAAGCWALLRG